MRYVLELEPDGDGRVAGTVAAAGGVPASFSGWLELLQLLGGDLARSAPPGGVDRPEEQP